MARPVPSQLRRGASGGYTRGDQTRERIIEAAFVVFADMGYAAASTRRIAAEADVVQPALQYYFGSKEGLHRACAQSIVDRVMEQLRPLLDEALAAANGDRKHAVDVLCNLIVGLAASTMAAPETPAWSRFMARCDSDRVGPASDIVDAAIGDPLKATVAKLVAKILGLPSDSPEARLRALLILSQLVILWSQRDDFLAAMRSERESVPDVALLENVLSDHIRRLVARK